MAKKSYAIIGLGRFGLSLLEELSKYTDNIIAIDVDENAVKRAGMFVNQCFISQGADEKQLKEVGIQDVDHAIICFGSNFEGTILTLVSLKNIGVKNITVRCDIDSYLPILRKLGATDIISPQKIAGIRLANRVVSNLSDYFNLTGDFCIVEVPVPDTMKTTSIINLDSRNRFGVNIILIQRWKESFAPKANDIIQAKDQLFVFGTKSQIIKFTDSLLD